MSLTAETTRQGTEDAQPSPDGWQTRLDQAVSRVRVEHVLYGAIFLAAVLSRFWGLGDRALHHDESLHAFYSWQLSEGDGYTHHPMMHGPFLFHFNALSYLLFGDSDFTTRLTAAVFGIALVMLPWLLRSPALLGRWGALATSVFILVSPSMTYYSRFIRHDIFAIVGAFLLFIALLRYMEKPESRWIILAVGSLGYVLTTHEVSFVNLFILGTFTGTLILYRVLPVSFAIIGAGLMAFLVTRILLVSAGVPAIPAIPWQEPSNAQVIRYIWEVISHPVTVAGLGIFAVGLITFLWLIDRERKHEKGWFDETLGATPSGTTAKRLGQALHDGRGWLYGALIGGSIFVTLYTTVFSNMGGLGSGTFGALGYWLGQHDVRRGDQPWFYYLVLIPQYEYLAVIGALAAGVVLVVMAWRRRTQNLEIDHRFYTLLLTAYWAIVMFVILSWAGEKMPWLIVHPLLPMLILTGAVTGLAIEWIERKAPEWRRKLGRYTLILGIPIASMCVSWFMLMSWASAGPWIDAGDTVQRTIREEVQGNTWWLLYMPLATAVVVAIIGIVRAGAARALTAIGATLAGLLLLLQVNAGWNLSYREGDIPRDMLIYVQTSPALKRTVNDLEALGDELTHDESLDIVYTGAVQWPVNWYLRDYPSRILTSGIPEEPDAPFILASPEDVGSEEERRLEDYSYIELPFRWWIPENESYRSFAISPEVDAEWRRNLQTDQEGPYSFADVARSVGRSLMAMSEPEEQADIFRLVVHRELLAPIGSFDFRLYIHEDYQRYFNDYRYSAHETG